MPTVYQIEADNGYQYLNSVNSAEYREESTKSWKFDGSEIGSTWKPVAMFNREPKLKKPDIWTLLRGALAFEPSAAEIVESCLEKSGEQLPLPFESRELVVFNTTYVLECLDLEKTVYPDGLPHMIKKFAFHLDRLDQSLFKIPQNTNYILTVEGLASPQDEFKPLVEKYGLKGLWFRPVWSSDST
jgi:hypothetical protein